MTSHRRSEDDEQSLRIQIGIRRRILIGTMVVLVLVIGGAVGLIRYLAPSKSDSVPSSQKAVTTGPAVGPGGACLGQYFAVPEATWSQHKTSKAVGTSYLNFELVNHGVTCKLTLPTQVVVVGALGSSRVALVAKTDSSFTFASGDHSEIRVAASYAKAACTTLTSAFTSITLEFGGQKLQVALPAKFRAPAWSSTCPTSASMTAMSKL